MVIHVLDSGTQVGQAAAALLAAQVLGKPESVLGLATGSTPIPVYEELVRLYRAGVLDFSHMQTFNLDEYCHMPVSHPESYRSFMQRHLFDHINIAPQSTHVPNGNAANPEVECAAYDAAIEAAGGIDIQLLGIGRNGHIGFNEPGDHFIYGTHVVTLAQSTIEANRRFFASEDEVPRQAISMGIGGIMKARRVILMATGASKAQAIHDTLRGNIDPTVQASILRTHPDVVFLLDKAAAGML